MKRTNDSPFDNDVRRKLETDPEYAAAYFEAISDEPLPIQMALLRRAYGISQERIASKLHMKQAQVSRLERKGSDHLLSTYQKVAGLLGSRIMIVHKSVKLVAA